MQWSLNGLPPYAQASSTIRWTESSATLLAPSAKTGDFVSWKASRGTGRGKVVSLHTASHVPGVPVRVEGSAQKPAARIRVYAKSANGWVPTDVHVAMHVERLSTTDPLPAPPEKGTEAVVPGSFDAIRAAVADAIEDMIEELAGISPYVYVCDLGTDWTVYGVGDDMFMVGYTFDATTGAVTLDGQPTEVYAVTTYEPVAEPAETLPPADPAPVADAPPVTPEAPVAQDPALADPPADPMMESDTLTGRLLAAAGTDTATGGRVFRVRVLAYGDSKNGRRYSEAVMRAAVPLYEGAKAFDHHRTEAELQTSTVAGIVGTYRNVEATGEGIDADLCLLPGATHIAELLEASLRNQSAGLTPLVGISHDVRAQYRAVRAADGRQLVEATQIVAVNSADVVAHPAAGGQATRLVASLNPKEGTHMTLKQLLTLLRESDAAKRAGLLVEHAALLESAGLTADDATRMAEAVAPEAPAAVGTVLAKGSILTRNLVETAVKAASLPATLVESVLSELPETFTESALTAKVEGYRRVLEGAEKAGLVPTAPDVKVTKDVLDKRVARLDAMFANSPDGYRSLKEAYADIMGVGSRVMLDSGSFAESVLRDCFYVPTANGRESYVSWRSTESLDSTSWAQIMGDSITRRMVAEYTRPELMNWNGVVATVGPAITDFRTQRITRMGGYGTIPAVAEGGTYQPLSSPGDEEATYAISKRGGTEDLTLEAIANDDLRAVQRIPQKLGLAAAQTLYRFVWGTCFTGNPTCTYDSVALFHSSHTNTTSTALTSAALNTSRIAMRKQAGYGDTSDVLSITPKTLITVPTLEHLAWQLVTSAVASPSGAPAGAASDIPNLHQGMQLVILDYYDATSSTFWAIAADPNVVPMIEVGFYQGRQQPELFTQADPTQGSAYTADKLSYKIRHIYGGTVLDHRGLSRGNS